jgi:PAS domain S-box-containing protein
MRPGTRKDGPGSDQGAHFQLLAAGGSGAALFVLSTDGRVAAWTAGAQRLLGYREDDILGEPFGRLFFRPEEVQRGEPEQELGTAESQGLAAGGRWYSRQDGTALWGEGVTEALRDASGAVQGFAKLLEDRTADKLAQAERRGPTEEDISRLTAAVRSCGEVLLGLLASRRGPA